MKPTVSFVIPAFNESANIGHTLDSIWAAKDLLEISEIVVLDNESSDDTAAIASAKGAKVLSVSGGPVARLRNIGVGNSSGDIIVFLDADVSLTDEWRQHIVSALHDLQENSFVLTGSHCSPPAKADNIFEKFWFASFDHSASSHLGTGHMIMTRQLFLAVEGFSESLETGEDYDICARVKRIGGVIKENACLRVIHNDFPKTIGTFIRREIWHGKGDTTSLKLMLKSKVVIASVIFMFLHLFFLAGLFLPNLAILLFSFVFLAGLLFVVSFKKYRRYNMATVFVNSLIYYFYFIGRSIAVLLGLVSLGRR